MISDGQARALLEECEAAVGRPLEGLRAHIARSKTSLSALWELVTLYAALPIGKGVDHEPREGCPDVLIDVGGVDRFWLEATHIRWPERDSSARIREFIDWVHRELKARHGVGPNMYHLQCDASDSGTGTGIPPPNTWVKLRRSQEWQSFAQRVKNREAGTVVADLTADFSVRLTLKFLSSPGRTVSSGYRNPNVVKKIPDHPVWSAIRSKAKQARKWRLDEPLVVCVGSSLSYSLTSRFSERGPSPDAAVYGALYDTSKWDMIRQYNILSDTSGTCYRVSGASRISAVLLVSIEDKVSLSLGPSDYRRIAKPKLFINEGARHPLSEEQLDALQRIHFNQIPYGPQWETWPNPAAREWKREGRITDRKDPGRMTQFAPGSDGSFELQIPADDLVRMLAGMDDVDSLCESIQDLGADRPLSKLPPLIEAAVIRGDAKQREADMVKLVFGPPLPPVVQALREDGK